MSAFDFTPAFGGSSSDYYIGDLAGTSGGGVVTPQQQARIAGSDNAWLENALKVVNTGISAYAVVQASKQAKAAPATTTTEAAKTGAPVIGVAAGGTKWDAKTIALWVVGGLVALLGIGLLLRRK